MEGSSLACLGLLTGLKEFSVACAAIVGAIVAWRGLKTWREQLTGRTEYELARRVLRGAYKLRDAINSVRNPFMSSGEMAAAAPESKTPEEASKSGSAQNDPTPLAYERRWEAVRSGLSDLEVEALEAEALWGPEAQDRLRPLYKCANELRVSLELYLRDQYSRRGPTGDRDFYSKLEAVVFSTSSADSMDHFELKVKKALQSIEEFYRPKLKI